MAKKALIFVTHGSEEMELVIVADILRRAKIEVTLYGVGLEGSDTIECSRGVKIQPDLKEGFEIDWPSFDALIIPGGAKGSEYLSNSSLVKEKIKYFNEHSKLIASVCAGTLALKAAGIKTETTLTSHPSVKDQLSMYNYSEERVVINNNIITRFEQLYYIYLLISAGLLEPALSFR
ncbi:hypothetical protein DSO57_1006226 [Entomophthora muscae]|uniref:Uncharacterized protein n=1 Tax=Entomophthora muscae TaxID=34485 RepID=A0ACC2RYN9_9FUNG|nr:hypothetical protein DSO57_1006226 [Entomophthora muscae]